MRPIIITLSTIWMILPMSCLDDDDRCGGLRFDPSNASCIRPFDPTDTATIDTGARKDGGVGDGGGDSEPPPPPPPPGAEGEPVAA